MRGRIFLHPNLGFTFTAPEGFALENTPQAVLGATANGREALRLDAVRVDEAQTLPEYISKGWVEGIDPATIETFQVNGFEVATARARGEQWSFRLFAIRFGSEVYRVAFAARELTPQLESSFREAVSSFRRVSAEEAQAIRPQKIRFHRVVAGDTPERLAQRSAFSDRHLERFLVLNGMQRGVRLTPGEIVKIVTE